MGGVRGRRVYSFDRDAVSFSSFSSAGWIEAFRCNDHARTQHMKWRSFSICLLNTAGVVLLQHETCALDMLHAESSVRAVGVEQKDEVLHPQIYQIP